MVRRMVRSSYLIAFLLAASFAIAQTEFSAEIVDTQKADNPNRAKIYMAKDKLRIEPTAGSTMGKGSGGAVIMNLATQTTTVLMDQQHMYMEMPPRWRASASPITSFVPVMWRTPAPIGRSRRRIKAEVATKWAAIP